MLKVFLFSLMFLSLTLCEFSNLKKMILDNKGFILSLYEDMEVEESKLTTPGKVNSILNLSFSSIFQDSLIIEIKDVKKENKSKFLSHFTRVLSLTIDEINNLDSAFDELLLSNTSNISFNKILKYNNAMYTTYYCIIGENNNDLLSFLLIKMKLDFIINKLEVIHEKTYSILGIIQFSSDSKKRFIDPDLSTREINLIMKFYELNMMRISIEYLELSEDFFYFRKMKKKDN